MDLLHYQKRLQWRGLETIVVPTGEEAQNYILHLIGDGSSVGIGGSVSLEQIGIYEKLLEKRCPVFWHSKSTSPAEGEAARRKALSADFYLCSANAVTKGGKIVNVDGKGNRIAAIAYGPETVIFLVGKNKLVKGGVKEAFYHIHHVICPKNAKRLNFDLPCGRNEPCTKCTPPQRMCNLSLIIDHVPRNRKYVVILVDEELGH